MSTEISTNVSVADRISDKIRAEFVNLISDEEWAKLVEREVRAFTVAPSRSYSSDPEPVSPLGKLVRDALTNVAQQKIAAEIDKLGNLQAPDGSDLVRQVVEQCASQMFASAMAPIVQNAIWTLRQDLESQINRTY